MTRKDDDVVYPFFWMTQKIHTLHNTHNNIKYNTVHTTQPRKRKTLKKKEGDKFIFNKNLKRNSTMSTQRKDKEKKDKFIFNKNLKRNSTMSTQRKDKREKEKNTLLHVIHTL